MHLHRDQVGNKVLAIWARRVELGPSMRLPKLVSFIQPLVPSIVPLSCFAHVQGDEVRSPHCEINGAIVEVVYIDSAYATDKDGSVGAYTICSGLQRAVAC